MQIGKKIQALRKQAGLTQHELAALMDSPRATLYHIEGDTRRPSDGKLRMIASALGITFLELIEDTDYLDDAEIEEQHTGCTVLVLRDKVSRQKRIIYYHEPSPEPYTGRLCKLTACQMGYPHRHCCWDCEIYRTMGCPAACLNHPDQCRYAVQPRVDDHAADHG